MLSGVLTVKSSFLQWVSIACYAEHRCKNVEIKIKKLKKREKNKKTFVNVEYKNVELHVQYGPIQSVI